VLLGLGELDLLGQLLELAIHAHPHIALAAKIEEELAILPLASAHHGARTMSRLPAGRAMTRPPSAARSARDDRAAARQWGTADPREEHAQVVVDLGHRATVERGFFDVVFCSIEMAGDSPSMESTSGFSICSRNCRA